MKHSRAIKLLKNNVLIFGTKPKLRLLYDNVLLLLDEDKNVIYKNLSIEERKSFVEKESCIGKTSRENTKLDDWLSPVVFYRIQNTRYKKRKNKNGTVMVHEFKDIINNKLPKDRLDVLIDKLTKTK